jgi:hypothetical protein
METVERVLSQRHEILGRVLFLDLFREKNELISSQKEYNVRRVIASRIDIGLPDTQLKKYFESFGTVENFFLIPGNDCNKSIKTAQVVFKEQKIAKKVRSVKNHRIGRFKFYVKRMSSQDKTAQNQMDSGAGNQPSQNWPNTNVYSDSSGSSRHPKRTDKRSNQNQPMQLTDSRNVPTHMRKKLSSSNNPVGLLKREL